MRTLCVVRIALVTRFDPWTPEAWPRMCQGYCGTAHWLLRELPRQGITVDAIGPLRECRSALWYLRGLWRAWRWRALYEGWAEPGLALSYASQVREQLRVGNYDVVLCDRSTYEQLARTAFAEYCARLSWPAAMRGLLEILQGVIATAPHTSAR